jgi:hypothetical protein
VIIHLSDIIVNATITITIIIVGVIVKNDRSDFQRSISFFYVIKPLILSHQHLNLILANETFN